MKRIFKRKKLNNKGFTLIELLAVVVILAIVMGIAATSVLRSINQSRTSSLLSAAQNAANTLNTWASEDSLITSSGTAHIGSESNFYKTVVHNGTADKSNTWYCLSDSMTINNGGSTVSILKALGLSGAASDSATGDVLLGTTIPPKGTAKRTHCSAVRYNSKVGGYEIFLSAAKQGKYYVANDGDTKNFAYSRASETNQQLAD